MNGTAKVTVNLNKLIPSETEAKIAWLEKYGPVAQADAQREVKLIAPVALWLRVRADVNISGEVGDNGEFNRKYIDGCSFAGHLERTIYERLRTVVRETGTLPPELDVSATLEELIAYKLAEEAAADAKHAERERYLAELAESIRRDVRCAFLVNDHETQEYLRDCTRLPNDVRDAVTAESQRRRDATEAAKAAAEAVQTAARNEWIAAHGSARLRRLVAEQIECEAVYRDERLALERPEWRFDDNSIRGAAEEIRNASEEALAILDEARKTAPDAKLVYWVADEERDDDGKFEYEEFRGAVCVGTFLDRQIVFRPPAEIVRS